MTGNKKEGGITACNAAARLPREKSGPFAVGKQVRAGMSVIAALVFGFALAGCGADDDGGSGPGNIPDPVPGIEKSISVYMQQPEGWNALYAYVWDDSGKEYSGPPPGTAMYPAGNEYASYSATAGYGYLNVRFSDGGENTTNDILGVDSDRYYKGRQVIEGKLCLNVSATTSIEDPKITAAEITDSTVTLAWSPIPDADGYVLYDEWTEYDDDDEVVEGSEWWHFQKVLDKEESGLYDDNYGEYLEPEKTYTWRLVAVKFKPDADFSNIEAMDLDDIDEDAYAATYTVIHDFGKFEATTLESSLPAPVLSAAAAGATAVRLTWPAVPGADYYEVYWKYEGKDTSVYPDNDWHYVADAPPESGASGVTYMDEDEVFIRPASSYSYSIVAVNERTMSKDSNEVSVTTASSPQGSLLGPQLSIVKAAAAAPAAPSGVRADPVMNAAGQVAVSWSKQANVSYIVGVFTSSSAATPVWKSPKQSAASLVLKHSQFSKALNNKLDFYVKVQAFASTNSTAGTWSGPQLAVAFPSGFGIAKKTPASSKQTYTVTMKDSFKGMFSNSSWSYGYDITYTDVGSNKQTVTKTQRVPKDYAYTFTGVPATAKAKVTVVPYIGNYYWSGTAIK